MDRGALELSNIGWFLELEGLPQGFWIAGDQGYICSNCISTPIASSMANRYQDAFNYFLSSHCVLSEQAIGSLKGRCGILWQPIQYNLQKCLVIVNTAMLLHNLTVNMGESGDLGLFAGSGFFDEAHEVLGRWRRWCYQGYDYYCDPVEKDTDTYLSGCLQASVGFLDKYSVIRARLCLIVGNNSYTRLHW